MEIALLDAPQPSDAEGGKVAAVDLVEDRARSDAEKIRGLRNAHERRRESGSALSHWLPPHGLAAEDQERVPIREPPGGRAVVQER